jgi:transcriptional regulator with XRE-family HTH domain
MANRYKYTEERAAQAERAIRMGLTYELAAGLAGVSADTLARWRKGRNGAPADFAERIEGAKARGALTNLLAVNRAARGVVDARGNVVVPPDWRAAAWLLEHRYPDQYGRKVREHQHRGSGGPIEIVRIAFAAEEGNPLHRATGERCRRPRAGSDTETCLRQPAKD